MNIVPTRMEGRSITKADVQSYNTVSLTQTQVDVLDRMNVNRDGWDQDVSTVCRMCCRTML